MFDLSLPNSTRPFATRLSFPKGLAVCTRVGIVRSSLLGMSESKKEWSHQSPVHSDCSHLPLPLICLTDDHLLDTIQEFTLQMVVIVLSFSANIDGSLSLKLSR